MKTSAAESVINASKPQSIALKSTLATVSKIEHIGNLHYVQNKRSWEDGPASENVMELQGVLRKMCKLQA